MTKTLINAFLFIYSNKKKHTLNPRSNIFPYFDDLINGC